MGSERRPDRPDLPWNPERCEALRTACVDLLLCVEVYRGRQFLPRTPRTHHAIARLRLIVAEYESEENP